ncbi:MAG: galactokinase [Betaproteobacteria bacterium]
MSALLEPEPQKGDPYGEKRERAARLRQLFQGMYGVDGDAAGEIHTVRAPGRVNLIGEHTDYNDGFVLPAAIDRDVLIAVRRRRDRRIRAYSLDYQEAVEFELDAIERDPKSAWSNYLRGTFKSLMKSGAPVAGMDLLVTGGVPQGAGLSSSAALEAAAALAAQAAGGFQWEKLELALACQAAENRFVGVNCGIMDQFASLLGKAGHALFIDCRTLQWETVPMPQEYCLVICDTGVRRGLRDSAYNRRRAECEEAVRVLRQYLPGVAALRDVSPESLSEFEGQLSEGVAQRAWHVVSENARVWRSVAALRAGQVAEFGRLMVESHTSLRDLFAVSCPELDTFVEIALELPGVAGARMTGAGFGGCTINLVRVDALADFTRTVLKRYLERTDPARFSSRPRVYVCRAEDGAEEISPDWP